MKCLICSKEINDNVKFCKFCGSSTNVLVKSDVTNETNCSNCGKPILSSAKFCNHCGTPTSQKATASDRDEVQTTEINNSTFLENFITWHIPQGELALKIDEKDILAYKTIKGIYIAPGTKALFFVNGNFAASLDSGKYAFKNLEYATTPVQNEKESIVIGFLKNICSYIANGIQTLFGKKQEKTFYSVVLIRGVDFPLVFDFQNIATKGLRTNIGLHILCKISNLNDFFNAQLVDKKILSIKYFADELIPSLTTLINQELSTVAPQDIDYNAELSNRILSALQSRFKNIYPYISVSEIISLTAKHVELDKIRELKEELYVSELELEQIQLRNDFLNRFQSVEHTNKLNMAREEVDFKALMDKIDEDHLLNEDKKEQFVQMLTAQAILRAARTETETSEALLKLKQTKLLSIEEYETLERAIKHRIDMDEATKGHEIKMATIQNKTIQDREALRWELEIGNKIVENNLERRRLNARFVDERRDANLDYYIREKKEKLNLAEQAWALREQREQAEHQRKMEAHKLQAETDLEYHRITATMSFEQIMASNPDITPEAAAALAKKFEAETQVAQSDKTAEILKQHDEDLKAILAQQMELTRDIISAQAQANSVTLASKQQELDRVHEDSERHQDRFLEGMQTTISAVARTSKSASSTPASTSPSTESTVVFCPNCGKKHDKSAIICNDCGTSL